MDRRQEDKEIFLVEDVRWEEDLLFGRNHEGIVISSVYQ